MIFLALACGTMASFAPMNASNDLIFPRLSPDIPAIELIVFCKFVTRAVAKLFRVSNNLSTCIIIYSVN